jgi:hypothetical protein
MTSGIPSRASARRGSPLPLPHARRGVGVHVRPRWPTPAAGGAPLAHGPPGTPGAGPPGPRPEAWRTWLPDGHPAYISWDEFMATGMQGRRPDRGGRAGRVRAALRAAALRAMRPPPEPPRRVAHTPRSLHGPPKHRRRCLGFRVGPSHRASVLAHWRFPLNEKKADLEIAIPLNRHGSARARIAPGTGRGLPSPGADGIVRDSRTVRRQPGPAR